MAEFGLDLSSLLTDEEATTLFDDAESPAENQEETPEVDNENEEAEKEEKPSEKVGPEDTEESEENTIDSQGDGSSPTKFYSSIASALKNDGIFQDCSDDEINAVESPDDFAELIEKTLSARMDERYKRINDALTNGVRPDVVKQYEATINQLSSITEDALSEEGDDGENLRKYLIYNDLINRGYSQDKANKEIEKSFKSGSDIEDAKDALDALKTFYSNSYDNLLKDAKTKAEKAKAEQKQNADKFRKMILEDEMKFGESSVDKKTRQKVFDAVSKPVYKDPDTGQILTQVQKFQKENPLEFLKQIGMWFVLTNEGKDLSGIIKDQVRVEKNNGLRELQKKINSSQLNPDGSLRYTSGTKINDDTLLSDGWNIDFGKH